MLGLLVVSLTCCISVHDGDGQWAIAILRWLSAPIFTIGDVLSLWPAQLILWCSLHSIKWYRLNKQIVLCWKYVRYLH